MHTNKYCNDVCDFFYAALYKSSRPYCCLCLCSAPPAAYQFIEISLGPATTTWHSTRAKFVEKICNIRFNEVTTWQRKKRVIKNMLEKINKQSTAEMYLKKKKRKNIYQASRLQLQVCRPQRSWQRECGKWKCVGGGIFQVHSRIKGRCVGGVSNFKEYVSVCVHAHTHHTHGIRTLVHTHTHISVLR